MSVIRHGLPSSHRVVRRGGWLVHNTLRDQEPNTPVVVALDLAALVAHLTTQGWLTDDAQTIGQVGSPVEFHVTLAQLEGCDIDHLADALEHDVRVELTRQGICS